MKLEKGTLRLLSGVGALVALPSQMYMPEELHILMFALGLMSFSSFLLLHFEPREKTYEIQRPGVELRYQIFLLSSAIGAATLVLNYVPMNLSLALALAGMAGAMSVRPKMEHQSRGSER